MTNRDGILILGSAGYQPGLAALEHRLSVVRQRSCTGR